MIKLKKKLLIILIILWILALVGCYLYFLPPFNPLSLKFWIFFGPALLLPLYLILQISIFKKKGFNKGKSLIPLLIVLLIAGVAVGGTYLITPTLQAKNFANRINVVTGSFEEDIPEVDFDNLPLLDKASSQKVGNRAVGKVAELVSQFNVSDEYSLINYKGSIVRVTPLEYTDFYKFMTNHKGTAGYVIVDTTTGEANLIQTAEGIRYLDSAYFFHDLNRHVQIRHPFSILGDKSFELDEEGNPYWIIQTLSYNWINWGFSKNIKPKVTGVIACNAITGETTRYAVADVPAWIDNVYDHGIVIDEINDWGMYSGGFINSQFSQKNVVQATEGYTYVTFGDDVYLYTGITSIAADESNIGFMMVNLRTHEAKYYAIPGAEEFSAMDSAVGMVQEKNYTSTFPLLINLEGRPTYLLSLKDDAGLVKMYGFVDVENYQKVSVSDAAYGIKKAAQEYLKLFDDDTEPEPTPVPVPDDQLKNAEETIGEVRELDGTFYVLCESNNRYEIKASINPSIVLFLKPGDSIQVEYYENDEGLRIVTKISLIDNSSGQENNSSENEQSGQETNETEIG